MAFNVDRLLQNNAPLEARIFHQRDPLGFDAVTVVAKLTWELDRAGKASLAVPPVPIRPSSERTSGAAKSSIRYPHDRPPMKPGTDVIMVANAYVADDQRLASVDVGLRIETGTTTLHKQVRVFGPRVFMRSAGGAKPGPGQPVLTTPIQYELAEGGADPDNPDFIDDTNLSGTGCRKDKSKLVGEEAYRIEPLGGTKPAGFGVISPIWSARKAFRGTKDQAYYKERHPIPPIDFDPRYYCDGHPDLWSEQPLLGDEPVEIVGATPEPTFRFKLPRYTPRFDMKVHGEEHHIETHLDTFLIDLSDLHPDNVAKHAHGRDKQDAGRRIVELSWRACIRLPKRSEHLEWVRITNATELDEEVREKLAIALERSA